MNGPCGSTISFSDGIMESSGTVVVQMAQHPGGSFSRQPAISGQRPQTPTGLTLDQTRAYELDWADLCEIVSDLRELLPRRLAFTLPGMAEQCPPWRKSYDIDRLLNALRIPDFSRHDTAQFPRHFPADVEQREFVLVCLKALLENGIGPQHRERDIDCALWILQNLPDGGFGADPPRRGRVSPRLVSDETILQWTKVHGALIESQVRQYTASGGGSSWSTRGLLRHLGYRVGEHGKPPTKRQTVLTAAVLLPARLLPVQHQANWGDAGTAQRVHEIRRMITLFYNLASGKTAANMSKARAHWQDDLAWLSQEFSER